MNSWVPYVVAIVPTIVAAAFFYVIVKRIMEADRRERLAQSKFEAEEERRHAHPEKADDATSPHRESEPENDS